MASASSRQNVPPASFAYTRRDFLAVAAGSAAALYPCRGLGAEDLDDKADQSGGLVITEPRAAAEGMKILAAGGNAVDAAVAAALVGSIVNVNNCGVGGYGGHLVIAWPKRPSARELESNITAIDFNTAAPADARPDMFPLDDNGNVKGKINNHGWLAAGVPGTLAGLQLALDKYGTLPLARVMQPAIKFARNGYRLATSPVFPRGPAPQNVPPDATIVRLFSRNGTLLKKGDTHRNPELAEMLEQLAENGSVDAFYRGAIGERIVQAFQKNGGLVTAEDMASYQAREVAPLVLDWRGRRIATAPLTAGGITVLQAIAALKALGWPDGAKSGSEAESGDSIVPQLGGPPTTQAWIEALRIAWSDRLALLGDPQHVDVPIERLLSEVYAEQSANKIKTAIQEKRPVPIDAAATTGNGTMHISAVDASGMMVALTLTHGNAFGAQVAVEGLGVVLGHGMSRFDPVPGRANSIAPGKRPLHNMCPTIVLRGGRPTLALGAIGGRRIPNTIFQVLLGCVGEDRSLQEAVIAPRINTEGGLKLDTEAGVSEPKLQYLKQIGYKISHAPGALVYAIERTADAENAATTGVADASRPSRPGAQAARPIITHAP